MPHYEYRCRDCTTIFVLDRPMSASGDPATCPDGHTDTIKLLSAVAIGGMNGPGGVVQPRAAAPAGGGGCCGGKCGCS